MPDSQNRISPIAQTLISQRNGEFPPKAFRETSLKDWRRIGWRGGTAQGARSCSIRVRRETAAGGGLRLGFDEQIGLVVLHVDLEVAEQQGLKHIVPREHAG